MSSATTNGIRVTVKTRYLPEQSGKGRWAFAYTIRIENKSDATTQLMSRHWIITDGNGEVDQVRGDGVVGEQPVLQPGESFEYTSGCVLRTPHGAMNGTYRMVRADGSSFDAVIAPFSLSLPNALN